MEMTPGTLSAIADLRAGFLSRLDPAMRAEVRADAIVIATELNRHVKIEFKAGTDKHGISHDKTGKTLADFHVEPNPVGAFVVGDYAALLVQDGSRPHAIDAHAGYLAFETAEGGFVITKHVNHPGYQGDDYVGRAISKTDLGPFVAHTVGAAYGALFLQKAGI